MSGEASESIEQVDNWVFDSLVNFLHGSIWKVPVVGFIEEKSVVFDPDSYNNMTEEKEEEFRKIHEEYKAVVDFMLSSFMEDLQVTPEQVEEACRVREHQSKTLPESHITKVALEQLWAAEDFTAFRRLMTRKNIDLQLQSLELLVAKYGVLSPALRSGDSDEPTGDDGEDDFLQVVIRYSDQLELFKCDYAGDSCSLREGTNNTVKSDDKGILKEAEGDECADEDGESKNMKLHLSGIRFKNNIATPPPIQYQATLTSSSTHGSSSRPNSMTKVAKTKRQASVKGKSRDNLNNVSIDKDEAQKDSQHLEESELTLATPPPPPTTPAQFNEFPSSLSLPLLPKETSFTEESKVSENETENGDNSTPADDTILESVPTPPLSTTVSPIPIESPELPEIVETLKQESNDNAEVEETHDSSKVEIPEIPLEKETEEEVENENNNQAENVKLETESQLIQLEAAETNLDGESKECTETSEDEVPVAQVHAEIERPSTASLLSPNLDEKTVAEIASTAPEQRRLLTAVRKALEINPDESECATSINIPKTFENDEDLQKRREYLRAQRDKLIAIKKQEREKLLLANTSATGGGQQPARPKSARAAQMAIRNPDNMRQASLSEKSLSARRALADRLKQELIEK